MDTHHIIPATAIRVTDGLHTEGTEDILDIQTMDTGNNQIRKDVGVSAKSQNGGLFWKSWLIRNTLTTRSAEGEHVGI